MPKTSQDHMGLLLTCPKEWQLPRAKHHLLHSFRTQQLKITIFPQFFVFEKLS